MHVTDILLCNVWHNHIVSVNNEKALEWQWCSKFFINPESFATFYVYRNKGDSSLKVTTLQQPDLIPIRKYIRLRSFFSYKYSDVVNAISSHYSLNRSKYIPLASIFLKIARTADMRSWKRRSAADKRDNVPLARRYSRISRSSTMRDKYLLYSSRWHSQLDICACSQITSVRIYL